MNEHRFAIYLNARAKRVSAGVVARIEELVPPDDIFFSQTPEHAIEHARTILERGYPTVFTGGGDGTVCRFINALYQASGGKFDELPALGVLSLGTGNALSRVVSSGNALQDLKTFVANPSTDTWSIPLVRHQDYLFPFGGAGIDAEILSDYEKFKDRVADGPLNHVLGNVVGYFVSFFATTGPRYISQLIRKDLTRIKVYNTSERAFQADEEGRRGKPYGPGELMFDGQVVAVMAGTIPLIGYGAKILPMVEQESEMFQLRVVTIGLARALVSLPELWKGSYRGKGFHDFFATGVRIEFSREMPFQAGGDLVGSRSRLELELVPDAIRLLKFI